MTRRHLKNTGVPRPQGFPQETRPFGRDDKRQGQPQGQAFQVVRAARLSRLTE